VALDDRSQQDGLSRGDLHGPKVSGGVPGRERLGDSLQAVTFPCVVATAMTLSELVLQGERADHPHAPSDRPYASTLEWLGLAVGEMPFLISASRTVDEINWRSTAPNAPRMQIGLIDALAQHLATSAALLHHAVVAHHQAHPALGGPEQALADVDFLSHALVEDHPPQWRRSDTLQGGYVTALAAAVQASGRLCQARVEEARGDDDPSPDAAAAVVGDALMRALATLLGHARLNARDREVVEQRAT
jgi:hypothetical protein